MAQKLDPTVSFYIPLHSSMSFTPRFNYFAFLMTQEQKKSLQHWMKNIRICQKPENPTFYSNTLTVAKKSRSEALPLLTIKPCLCNRGHLGSVYYYDLVSLSHNPVEKKYNSLEKHQNPLVCVNI